MGSLGNPQAWPRYENMRDCSQGFCSMYCRQWCYMIYPPPPPLTFSDDDDSKANFSPLIIAIIGILASAFLLVSYYTVISKYCGNRDSSRRNNANNHDPSEGFNENQNQSNNELCQVSTTGLDEALIKLITVCRYVKGDGLIEGTDCSVCLGEFQENDNLRLLPKCSHAFHLSCIDTWLKSHSNCPLCRANVTVAPLQLPPLPVQQERPSDNDSSTESEEDNHSVVVVEDLERRNEDFNQPVPKTHSSVVEKSDAIIEIKDGEVRASRRSMSMDSPCQGPVSIADILSTSEDEESDPDIHECEAGVESSSKRGHSNKSNSRSSRVVHCLASPTAMERSFSSGRFFIRQGCNYPCVKII